MRKLRAWLGLKAKDFHRQPADRAGHPVAIKVELGPRGRSNIRSHVHFHAVDNSQEVGLIKVIVAHRLGEIAGARRRGPAI